MTFLFTDVEGSTRLWQDEAQAMASALARHDEILRGAIDRHDGYVFSTAGDAFAAAFGRSGEAVAAASEAQCALLAEQWPNAIKLRVRMGIHTGEAAERDGDYFGPTVNRAARLMAIGSGGQVLVSGTTAQLLDGVELRDLGEHRLRDLTRPEHVFQLLDTALPVEFPRLRSLDAFPTNLPLQLTSFVGREDEMKQVRDLLIDHRLVTLTGVGGVGKTRLALQIGAEISPAYPNGVWVCELAPAESSDALVDVVALTLRVSRRSGLSLLESMVEFLRSKHLVLIIDNCEHLLRSAADLVSTVLAECERVTVLATSREGLGLAGEQLWPVRSLDVDPSDRSDVAGEPGEAVRLFLERARAVDPAFSLDRETIEPVVEICRRLDGLPLAIELAAARVGALSPPEIAALLDERFRLLTGARNRTVERHRTLRGAVDWSYSLLAERDRAVFDRLGVFVGSFDTEAAQAVAGADDIDRFEVLDVLAELVAKSMLTVVRSAVGQTRYELLETLRQYALEQLEHGDLEAARRRHAAYYANLASTLGPLLKSDAEVDARKQVLLALDNLRAAMGWALDADAGSDQLLGVRIVASLAGLVADVRSSGFGPWAERALTAARAGPPELRFAVLGAAAFHATTTGDLVRAKELTDEAFVLGELATCPERTQAHSSRAIAMSATDLAAASDSLRRSVDELEQLGDTYAAVTLLSIAGMFAALVGDTAAGQRETEKGLAGARKLRNPTALVVALFGFALTRWQDEPDEARAAIEESLALTAAGASDVIYADALELLARIERESGDAERALSTIGRSLRVSIDLGIRPSVTSSQWYLVEALGLLDREPETAAILHGVTTRGKAAHLMPLIAGREAELHARAIDAVRERLGERRLEALADRGAAMSYDEATDFTMAEIDRIIAASTTQ